MVSRLMGGILRSAWPGSSIDHLLRAIALVDREKAAASWRTFEAEADFDNLTWGEFRLISLAAKRLADLAPSSPMRPRIAGIERSIWSRSQIVIGEAATGLRRLAAEPVEMLVMKGAGRAASRDPVARGRIVNDIDIVLHPVDLQRAYDILVEEGWTPAGSGSLIYNRSRLPHLTGMNMVRGEFGNIDIHRTPFHAPYDREGDDEAIWRRSVPGKLGYADVRIPSALDTIVIAIAHGSLDAHKSSDWIADIAASVDKGVDWDLFLEIATRRRLRTAAAIALGYVRERLERPIPDEIIRGLERAAFGNPVKLVATVAEARPKSDRLGLFWLARAAAKQSRLFRVRRRTKPQGKIILPSFLHRPRVSANQGEFALEQELLLPNREDDEAWSGMIDLEIEIDLPPATRRLEFEINSGQRHLIRLRGLAKNKGRRRLPLRFRAKLDISPGDTALRLQAVPARSFNTNATNPDLIKYGPTPFRIVLLAAKKSSARA